MCGRGINEQSFGRCEQAQQAVLAIQPGPSRVLQLVGPKRDGVAPVVPGHPAQAIRRYLLIDIDAGHTLPVVDGDECM